MLNGVPDNESLEGRIDAAMCFQMTTPDVGVVRAALRCTMGARGYSTSCAIPSLDLGLDFRNRARTFCR
jgi:hypothetical protein